MLELLEDVPRRDHQDPLAPPPPDQLGEDHPHLERLAQAHGIRDEQARPDVRERLVDRPLLVLQVVEELTVRDGEPRLGRRHRRLADHRLEVEPRTPEAGRGVGNEERLLRAQRHDPVELGEEGRLRVTDQRRQPDAADHQAVGRCLVRRAHQPLLVAHLDLRPGRDEGEQLVRRGHVGHLVRAAPSVVRSAPMPIGGCDLDLRGGPAHTAPIRTNAGRIEQRDQLDEHDDDRTVDSGSSNGRG